METLRGKRWIDGIIFWGIFRKFIHLWPHNGVHIRIHANLFTFINEKIHKYLQDVLKFRALYTFSHSHSHPHSHSMHKWHSPWPYIQQTVQCMYIVHCILHARCTHRISAIERRRMTESEIMYAKNVHQFICKCEHVGVFSGHLLQYIHKYIRSIWPFAGFNLCRTYGSITSATSAFYIDLRTTTSIKHETTGTNNIRSSKFLSVYYAYFRST